jgi:hypothetical protein
MSAYSTGGITSDKAKALQTPIQPAGDSARVRGNIRSRGVLCKHRRETG